MHHKKEATRIGIWIEKIKEVVGLILHGLRHRFGQDRTS